MNVSRNSVEHHCHIRAEGGCVGDWAVLWTVDADGAGLMEGCRRRVVFDVKNNTVGGYDEEGCGECDFDNVWWGGAEVWYG